MKVSTSQVKKVFMSMLCTGAMILLACFSPVRAQGTPTPTSQVSVAQTPILSRAQTISRDVFDKQFLNRLNALRANISSNKKLTSESKQALLAKIDAEITWFTNKQAELELTTAVPKLRSIVREARTRFQGLAKEIRLLYVTGRLIVSLETVIANLETNILAKIEVKVMELESKGADMSTENALIDRVKGELTNAKTQVDQTKTSTTIEDAKKHSDLAKTHVRNASKLLKEVLLSIKTKL